MNVNLSQRHYWWGDCVFCDDEPMVIIASNQPISDTYDFEHVPDCPRCGRSLNWNEGA